jgi:hypothetical protein
MDDFTNAQIIGSIVGVIIALYIFFLPAILAYNRKHAYKEVILVLNIFGFTGIIWLVAMVWAIFPSEKSLIDPVVGNVTGTGLRNAGDTVGAASYSADRGADKEKVVTEKIEKLGGMLKRGTIDEAEFRSLKSKLIDNWLEA